VHRDAVGVLTYSHDREENDLFELTEHWRAG
jgi:hypothetical protein